MEKVPLTTKCNDQINNTVNFIQNQALYSIGGYLHKMRVCVYYNGV